MGRGAEYTLMEKLLSDLKAHSAAWPFLQPVNAQEVPDYYDVITHPMGTFPACTEPTLRLICSYCADFSTMEHKLETNQYHDTDAFLDDAQLIYDNCRMYNPEETVYHRSATRLEKYMKEQMKALGLVRSSKVKRERDE